MLTSKWRQAVRDGMLNVRCRVQPYAIIDEVVLPLDLRISPLLRRIILEGEYEHNELTIVRTMLDSEDRVLECGAGIGLLASYCALRIGSGRIQTFEANPLMRPLIERTFALNHVSPRLIIGAIGPRRGELKLHIRENFWSTSSHDGRAVGSLQSISVPMFALHEEIIAARPTFLLIDIEGAEQDLAGASDLPGVSKIMMEVHPELIGKDGVRAVLGWLSDLRFRTDRNISQENELFLGRH